MYDPFKGKKQSKRSLFTIIFYAASQLLLTVIAQGKNAGLYAYIESTIYPSLLEEIYYRMFLIRGVYYILDALL